MLNEIALRKIIRDRLNQTNKCKAKYDFYGSKGYALVNIKMFVKELAEEIRKKMEAVDRAEKFLG